MADVPELRMTVPSTAGTEYDLDESVRRYVANAVRKYRLGERYWYSVTGTVVPGPHGALPGYVVTLYRASPVLGSGHLMEGVVQTGFPTEEEFDRIVQAMIEGLRKQASAALR